jgi:hypothetical protein
MHTHIAVINEDNKVIAVVKLGDQFKERLATAISDEGGGYVHPDQFTLPTSPEMIRESSEIYVSLEGKNYPYHLSPTWEY